MALGTIGLYGLLLVGGTAALAGSIGRRIWLPVHWMAVAVFAACLVHGVTAGSDTHALRWLYVATGTGVTALLVTRRTARGAASDAEGRLA